MSISKTSLILAVIIIIAALLPMSAFAADSISGVTATAGLNGDEYIDPFDFSPLIKYLLDPTTPIDKDYWDINKDGQVDVLDLLTLKRLLLGMA